MNIPYIEAYTMKVRSIQKYIKRAWSFTLLNVVYLVSISLLIILIGNYALYAKEYVYTVTDVEVDVTGKSSAKAREMAFIAGQKTALETLYERLVLQEDISKLSSDRLIIEELISSFEVLEEKVSPTRYRAKLKVSFDPGSIRNYLRRQLVRFAETQSEGVLVIPIFLNNGFIVPWVQDNRWNHAWSDKQDRASLLPFVPIKDNLENIHQVEDFYNLNTPVEKIRETSQHHGFKITLIAIMDYSNISADNLDNLIADVFELDYPEEGSTNSGIIDSQNKTEKDQAAFFPEGEISVKLRYIDVNSDTISHLKFKTSGKQNTKTLFSSIVGNVVGTLREKWKVSNLLRFDQENELYVSVSVNKKLRNWVHIQQELLNMPIITRIKILELSNLSVILKLGFLGGIDKLEESLMEKNLELNIDEFGWNISQNIELRESQ